MLEKTATSPYEFPYIGNSLPEMCKSRIFPDFIWRIWRQNTGEPSRRGIEPG